MAALAVSIQASQIGRNVHWINSNEREEGQGVEQVGLDGLRSQDKSCLCFWWEEGRHSRRPEREKLTGDPIQISRKSGKKENIPLNQMELPTHRINSDE